MSRKYNEVIPGILRNNRKSASPEKLTNLEKDILSKILAVDVIKDRSFNKVADYYWYIGKQEYESLVDRHIFKYMKNLRSLRLHYVVTDENTFHKLHLQQVRQIYQEYTQQKSIDRLPDEIGDLKELVTLDLSHTGIKNLPDEVGNLSRLEYLFLDNSLIEEIPEWINKYTFPKLKTLTLMSLRIRNIPKEIMSLRLAFKDDYIYDSWESGIFIKNLSITTQPVSLFYQNRKLIEDYYRESHIAVSETKVIFLGSEGVGKTHTIKRIINDNQKIYEDLKETPGISITSKDFCTDKQSYRINFWDFGGQEIMHSMHRCFLTNRTGYVIVVSTRFGDVTAQARAWLRNLQSFANDAPVIIFVNVWNDGTYYGIDENTLRREFPNIVAVLHCSAKDSECIEFADVTLSIQRMAEKNESISMQFPETWENIRQDIIKRGKHDYHIEVETYKKICYEHSVNNNAIQGWLLDWFNDLGECFTCLPGEKMISSNQYGMILNPEWLTNAVYLIIRELGDDAEKGIVSHKRIKKLLGKTTKGTLEGVSYTSEECEDILEVMRRHQLSYKIPAKEAEFIPSLLHNSMRNMAITSKTVPGKYEMRYKYLPENVLHQLMVEYYALVDKDNCWRDCFTIEIQGIHGRESCAFISADYNRCVINIQIEQHSRKETWELLQAIRDKILEINDKMNLQAQDFIAVDSLDENGNQELVSLKRLLKLQSRGIKYYEAYEKRCNIDKILGKTYGETFIQEVKRRTESDKEYSIDGIIEKLGRRGAKSFLSLKIRELISIDDVYDYVMSACRQIQGRMIFWSIPGHDVSEDSRNDEMRDLIGSRYLYVRDQSHVGHGEKSYNPGEVDLAVMKSEADPVPMTLIEAMNLSCVNSAYIRKHLDKLADGYNDSGLRDLFLVSYVELEKIKFPPFWNRYKKKIMLINGDKIKVDTDIHPVINESFAWIKSIKIAYDYAGEKMNVYHICVRVAR